MGRKITMTGKNAQYIEHRGVNATPDNDREIRMEGDEAVYEEYAYGQASQPKQGKNRTEDAVKEYQKDLACKLLMDNAEYMEPKVAPGYARVTPQAVEATNTEKFIPDVDAIEQVGAPLEEEIHNEQSNQQEELNYFAPTKNLQNLLREDWFAKVRTKEEYNEEWTDAFVRALMESKWKDDIAKDWAVKGVRNKKDQIKGYVVGLLKDAGVLKGSYDSIASQVGITDDPRTFSKYMGRGKKQPYADWVKDYVSGIRE